jgi:hypothetical protein
MIRKAIIKIRRYKVPTFRVKNLSVSIGKQERIERLCHYNISCLLPTWNFCKPYTPFCFYTPCRNPTCPGASIVEECFPTHVLPDPTTVFQMTPEIVKVVDNLEVLDLLRGQLEEALSVAKARGVEIEESMRPQTLKDVESLETELQAALDELRAMKKKMSQ